MIDKIISWVKENKLVVVLLLVVGYLLWSDRQGSITPLMEKSVGYDMAAPSAGLSSRVGIPPVQESAPQPDVDDRMVVEHSNISLVVDNVRQKTDQILDYVAGRGGYMVSSSIRQLEEVPFGTVVVRVPSDELRPTLEYLRGQAIKVTSEYLSGRDVTDEYVDLESRLETLNKTKTKFEQILDQAAEVEDILNVQRELISLQKQIDNLIGRQEYLEKTAENAKITIYLSTDEWSLPYTPETEAFRPRVIFKQAVRSLVLTLRKVGKSVIWAGVFTPIWLPILLLVLWRKRSSSS